MYSLHWKLSLIQIWSLFNNFKSFKKRGENTFSKQAKSNRLIESKNGKSLANQKDAIFLNKPMESAFVIVL